MLAKIITLSWHNNSTACDSVDNGTINYYQVVIPFWTQLIGQLIIKLACRPCQINWACVVEVLGNLCKGQNMHKQQGGTGHVSPTLSIICVHQADETAWGLAHCNALYGRSHSFNYCII